MVGRERFELSTHGLRVRCSGRRWAVKVPNFRPTDQESAALSSFDEAVHGLRFQFPCNMSRALNTQVINGLNHALPV